MITKETRRRYRLHYNLRRKGNVVFAKSRMVFRRATVLPDVETEWVQELLGLGYWVMDWLFGPEHY